MADSAASSQSRSSRAGTSKRRSPAVSTDTENKLARAARSAQRLAQLSDASRDDSTLDLFPDDPTRATLEAMNIDIRQGTLHGFELPDVVRAALGASADAPAAPLAPAAESRSARRAARGDRTEPVRESVMLDGFERIEPSVGPTPPVPRDAADADGASAVAADVGAAGATATATATAIAAAGADSARATPPGAPSMSTAEAVAAVARGMHALREAATPAGERASGQPGAQPQRVAATVTRAATASREPAAPGGSAAGPAREGLAAKEPASETTTTTADVPPARRKTAADRPGASFVAPAPAKDAAPGAPELDRARATAFADTVDALYGVISDQRRAATDHSRRMKAMLSIVVGALLVTVAIGIVQTALLMRLTRETAAQQQHIAQMMQDQRTAMTGLLDERLAAAVAAAASAAAAQRPAAAPARERGESRHKVQRGHARAHGVAASASAHGARKVARAG